MKQVVGNQIGGEPRDARPTPKLSVVVMAYNEAASLAEVIGEIDEELRRLGATHEILIVDDGSSDLTGQIADRLAGAIPTIRVIHHGANRGLGAVYRTAFAEARGDWLTFFPADGQFPASIIGHYAAAWDDADMILGTVAPGRRPIAARLLSLGERLLLRALFGYFPRFQGILMFRRRLLGDMRLVSTGRGWTVLMEMVLRAARGGARILHVPIAIRPRAQGRSKVNNLRSIASNLRQVLALRIYL